MQTPNSRSSKTVFAEFDFLSDSSFQNPTTPKVSQIKKDPYADLVGLFDSTSAPPFTASKAVDEFGDFASPGTIKNDQFESVLAPLSPITNGVKTVSSKKDIFDDFGSKHERSRSAQSFSPLNQPFQFAHERSSSSSSVQPLRSRTMPLNPQVSPSATSTNSRSLSVNWDEFEGVFSSPLVAPLSNPTPDNVRKSGLPILPYVPPPTAATSVDDEFGNFTGPNSELDDFGDFESSASGNGGDDLFGDSVTPTNNLNLLSHSPLVQPISSHNLTTSINPTSSFNSTQQYPTSSPGKQLNQAEALRQAFASSAMYKKQVADSNGMDVFANLTGGQDIKVTEIGMDRDKRGDMVEELSKILKKLVEREYLKEAVECETYIRGLGAKELSTVSSHVTERWRKLLNANPRPADRPSMQQMLDRIRTDFEVEKAQYFLTKFDTNLVFLAQARLQEAVEAQEKAVSWFRTLTTCPFHSHAQNWTKCLTQAETEFKRAIPFYRSLAYGTSSSERALILAHDKVKNYALGILQILKLMRRIRWSLEQYSEFLKEADIKSVKGLLRKCEGAWEDVEKGAEGAGIKLEIDEEKLPKGSVAINSLSQCSLCLVPFTDEAAGPQATSQKSLSWAGKVYHAPCVNFWFNAVREKGL